MKNPRKSHISADEEPTDDDNENESYAMSNDESGQEEAVGGIAVPKNAGANAEEYRFG